MPYILVNNCQIKLEFVANDYFKVPSQDPEPKVKYSENKIFVTSLFGTLSFSNFLPHSYCNKNLNLIGPFKGNPENLIVANQI